MPAVLTDAIVLHAFDYLETSRIVRLATREAGVVSVIARGARRSRARYGTALDLFAGGTAELSMRAGRDLHTLSSFDLTTARASLGGDLARFTAASALAELVLRFGAGEEGAEIFDALEAALDAVGAAQGEEIRDAALAGAWRLVSALGFAPAVDLCASCHAELPADVPAHFSHPAGGALCRRCVSVVPSSRTVPAAARAALRGWIAGGDVALAGDGERRAHQRLLREFLQEHLADGRPLTAYDAWERERWNAQPTQSGEAAP